MAETNSVRLTIAITTRNRADYIGETLDSILPQVADDTEVLILDGASTDNTPQVVADYQRRFPALRYVRLEVNGGVDRDFDRSVGYSRGEYCWLMTDDDLLREGAVSAVRAAIRRSPSLVIVNAEVRNPDLSEVVEARRLAFPADRKYNGQDLDRIFAETAFYLSFIGCVVIRRSIWLSRDRESYYGSLFVHMGVIFQQPLPGEVIALAEPFITIRYGIANWIRREFEIWMFKYPEFIWSFPLVSAEAKAAVTPRQPWRKAARLLLFRAKGAYTRAEYTKWIRPQLRSVAERIRFGGVLLVPGSIANVLALLYCAVSRKSVGLKLVELKNSPHYFRNWLRRSGPVTPAVGK